jgi:hypothetical protein
MNHYAGNSKIPCPPPEIHFSTSTITHRKVPDRNTEVMAHLKKNKSRTGNILNRHAVRCAMN